MQKATNVQDYRLAVRGAPKRDISRPLQDLNRMASEERGRGSARSLNAPRRRRALCYLLPLLVYHTYSTTEFCERTSPAAPHQKPTFTPLSETRPRLAPSLPTTTTPTSSVAEARPTALVQSDSTEQQGRAVAARNDPQQARSASHERGRSTAQGRTRDEQRTHLGSAAYISPSNLFVPIRLAQRELPAPNLELLGDVRVLARLGWVSSLYRRHLGECWDGSRADEQLGRGKRWTCGGLPSRSRRRAATLRAVLGTIALHPSPLARSPAATRVLVEKSGTAQYRYWSR